MASTALSATAAGRAQDRVAPVLGPADRTRLAAVVALVGRDGRIRLDSALAAVFPALPRAAAQTAFRQFRSGLDKAAAKAGVAFALEVDSLKRSPPEERWCWFTGADCAVETGTALSRSESSGVVWAQQDVLALAKVTRRPVKYFVSYAHADAMQAGKLLRLLGHFLEASARYDFQLWHDSDIVLGSDWHRSIQQAIGECDFGLLLVSSAFLSRKYIKDNELPHFVSPDPAQPEPGKLAAPVMLKTVPLDGSMDLRGLETRQIFCHSSGQAFSERRTSAEQEAFARQLFAHIDRMLSAAAPTLPSQTEHPSRRTAPHDDSGNDRDDGAVAANERSFFFLKATSLAPMQPRTRWRTGPSRLTGWRRSGHDWMR
jgi:hypothetical protein